MVCRMEAAGNHQERREATMSETKKTIAVDASVAADAKQSPVKTTNDSITLIRAKSNAGGAIHKLETFNMPELYDKPFKARAPVIDGLLYPDTYLFCGTPKIGKSFMMLQIAYHVASGRELWGYEVRQGVVLYMALEDDERRLQERLYRMFDVECTEDLYMATHAGTLSSDLFDQLTEFVQTHPDTTLIIIDTLKRIRDDDDDEYSYASDYDAITSIKQFADDNDICLMVVHHSRKQPSKDIFDMISGTNGLLGAADGGFMFHRDKRTSSEGVLDVTGRDQPEQTLYLNRDPDSLCWVLDKAEMERFKVKEDPIIKPVVSLMDRTKGSWSGSATDLISALGIDINAIVLSKKLNVNVSKLMNDHGIVYENTRTHEGRRISLFRTDHNA